MLFRRKVSKRPVSKVDDWSAMRLASNKCICSKCKLLSEIVRVPIAYSDTFSLSQHCHEAGGPVSATCKWKAFSLPIGKRKSAFGKSWFSKSERLHSPVPHSKAAKNSPLPVSNTI